MLAKLALAALLGALAGMALGTHWVLSRSAPAASDLYGAKALAQVEGAWHAVRRHR